MMSLCRGLAKKVGYHREVFSKRRKRLVPRHCRIENIQKEMHKYFVPYL